LRRSETYAREMSDEKFERAKVRELCRSSVVVLTTGARERMVGVRIIVNRGFAFERRVNLRLRFRRAKFVESRDVQHQRIVQILRFVETFLDADAVITN